MISPRFGSMGWFKPQQCWGGIKILSPWLLGSCRSQRRGQGTQPAPPMGHTGQREGQVPSRAAPRIRGTAQQHEPDPELSLGVCTPMETDVVFPAHRDALARVPPGGRGIFQPGTSRAGSVGGQPGLLPSPLASAGSESRLLHGEERRVQPCIQKYLYCSLRCPWPSPARSPHGLPATSWCRTWHLQPVARLSRGCSRLAPAQPRAWCYREQSRRADPAAGRQAAASLLRAPSVPPSPSGLQVVGEPQQLLLAVDGFQVLQVCPGGNGTPHAQGLLRACQGELRSGLGSCLWLGSPIPPPAQLANPLPQCWLISWIPLHCLSPDSLIRFHCCWLGSLIPSITSSSAHRTSLSPLAWLVDLSLSPLAQLIEIPSIASPSAHGSPSIASPLAHRSPPSPPGTRWS